MSKVFIDTNVLVYAMDEGEPRKQRVARTALAGHGKDFQGALSTQVLQEFYYISTRKKAVDPLVAKSIVRDLDARFEIVTVSPEIILDAIDCGILSQMSFWDALIVTCAQSAQCETIWTEDLQEGQIIRGVRVENPFA